MNTLRPTIDSSLCTACGLCIRDCPYSVLRIAGDSADVRDDAYCCACGHCVAVCPEEAVALPEGDEARDSTTAPAPEAIEALIAARRSVRFFRAKDVPRPLIDRLLDGAAHAPSGCNARSASVTVIVDPFLRKAIAQDTKRLARPMARLVTLPGVAQVMRRLPSVTLQRAAAPEVVEASRVLLQGGVDHREWVTLGAPVLLLFHARPGRPTPAEDCLIAADHVTLLAPSLGLATCWNGVVVETMNAMPWLRWRARLPRGERVYAVLAVGWPAIRYPRSAPRVPIAVRYV